MLENNEILKLLKKLIRTKELLRILFYSIVLTIAFFRIRHGGIAYDDLINLTLTITAIMFIATLLTVILWHFTIYENVILIIKDFITRKLNILNYRHWINNLAQEMNCEHVYAEGIYGILKWDNPGFEYPHKIANVITPALHTFYLIPIAWLPTYFWTPQWDLILTIGVLMIPLSFMADITWERIETGLFISNEQLVRAELEKYITKRRK